MRACVAEMLSALLRDERRARWVKDDVDDDGAGTRNDALVPLPSDEDACPTVETDASTTTTTTTTTMHDDASSREECPRGTPDENRRALLARMEVIQRWPERDEASPEELNRSEMFSRSYDGSNDMSDKDDTADGRDVRSMTTSKSTSALNPSRRLAATKPTVSRSRRFRSEADLTRLPRDDDPGRARFGPDTALMLVDVQPVYWSLAPEIREGFPDFEENISSLLACAREAGSPIIHVKASYSDATCPWLKQFRRLNPGRSVYEINPDDVEPFAKPRDGEIIVNKDTFGAFIHAPDLAPKLRKDGVHTIVFAGLITSVCVQHSVFGGFNAGFRVVVAHDACGDRSRARHDAALMLYGDYMYDVTSTNELIKETHESKTRTKPALTAIPPVHQRRTIPRRTVSTLRATDIESACVSGLPSPVSSLSVSLSQVSLVDHHRKHAFSPVSALDLPQASL